jgi:hypothetical protein
MTRKSVDRSSTPIRRNLILSASPLREVRNRHRIPTHCQCGVTERLELAGEAGKVFGQCARPHER